MPDPNIASVPPPPEPRWWEAPVEFASHTLTGLLIFTLIALAALAIGRVVSWCEAWEADPVIIFALHAAEYAVITVDLILFGIFLVKTATRAARRL